MKSKSLCKGERSSLDIISTLPQTILENILCLLPTEVAARTSILSREWRYKWTKIPKLKFYLAKRISKEKQVQGKKMDTIYDLHQILLLHQGPIHEFNLDMGQADHDSFGFDQIIRHLSKNHTVKKLTLSGLYELPTSVFLMHHLTHLKLFGFDIDKQPILSGFGSLESLCLFDIRISTITLLDLLSKCPSLKSFSLLLGDPHLDEDCNIIELFKCLSVIENLTCAGVVEWIALDSVPKELPTLLVHLKHFCFEQMCFLHGYDLVFLLVLIKCSPNLEKIKLEVDYGHVYKDCYENYSVVWEEYSNVWLQYLIVLEIEGFSNLKLEMEFVKFILARSPKLKKVSIRGLVYREKESEMLKTLLEAPRASPVIITVR